MADDDQPTVLDQPWQLELYHLLQLKYRLKLEVTTGMGFRQSTLAMTNDVLVRNKAASKPFRNKKDALERLDDYITGLEIIAGVPRA